LIFLDSANTGAKQALPESSLRNYLKTRQKRQESKKREKPVKNQSKIGEDTLFCAGYMVVITSLGSEYSGEEILYLYKSR